MQNQDEHVEKIEKQLFSDRLLLVYFDIIISKEKLKDLENGKFGKKISSIYIIDIHRFN